VPVDYYNDDYFGWPRYRTYHWPVPSYRNTAISGDRGGGLDINLDIIDQARAAWTKKETSVNGEWRTTQRGTMDRKRGPTTTVPVPELVVAGETMDRKRGPTCGVSE
jgi:hypothetical protein